MKYLMENEACFRINLVGKLITETVIIIESLLDDSHRDEAQYAIKTSTIPWYVDIVNYLACSIIVFNWFVKGKTYKILGELQVIKRKITRTLLSEFLGKYASENLVSGDHLFCWRCEWLSLRVFCLGISFLLILKVFWGKKIIRVLAP